MKTLRLNREGKAAGAKSIQDLGELAAKRCKASASSDVRARPVLEDTAYMPALPLDTLKKFISARESVACSASRRLDRLHRDK